MELKTLDFDLTVCKLARMDGIDLDDGFYFIGKTDEEIRQIYGEFQDRRRMHTEDLPFPDGGECGADGAFYRFVSRWGRRGTGQ